MENFISRLQMEINGQVYLTDKYILLQETLMLQDIDIDAILVGHYVILCMNEISSRNA